MEGVSAKRCEKLIRAVDLFRSHQAVLDNLHGGFLSVCVGQRRQPKVHRCVCVCVMAQLASLDAFSGKIFLDLDARLQPSLILAASTRAGCVKILRYLSKASAVIDLMTVWGNVGLIY